MKRVLSTKVIDIDNIDGVVDSYRRAIERDGFEDQADFDRCFDRLQEKKPIATMYRVNIEIQTIKPDEW